MVKLSLKTIKLSHDSHRFVILSIVLSLLFFPGKLSFSALLTIFVLFGRIMCYCALLSVLSSSQVNNDRSHPKRPSWEEGPCEGDFCPTFAYSIILKCSYDF